MSEKKQLNDEQLEKVNGGGYYASDKYLPASHGAHIRASVIYDHKEIYLGKKLYCVMDKNCKYYAVITLNDVKAADWDIWEYVTINEIPGDFYNGDWEKCVVGSSYKLNSTYYTMYALEPGYEASL